MNLETEAARAFDAPRYRRLARLSPAYRALSQSQALALFLLTDEADQAGRVDATAIARAGDGWPGSSLELPVRLSRLVADGWLVLTPSAYALTIPAQEARHA